MLVSGEPLAIARILPCNEIFARLQKPSITAAESKILDRAVLRDFEDLTDIEAPSGKAADAWNARVVAALDRTPMTVDTEYEKPFLNQMEVVELYRDAKSNDVMANTCGENSRYEKQKDVTIGFCFGRAVGVHLLARNRNLTNQAIRKVWAVGAMPADDITWSHHVATAVRGAERWYVIDPLFDYPVPVSAWIDGWKHGPKDKLLLFATKPDRFGPESKEPLYPATTKRGSYFNFFYDLFKSVRKEGETVADQLRALSTEP